MGRPLPADVIWYAVPPVPVGHGDIRLGADILLLDKRTSVVIDVAAAFPL